MTLFTFRGGVHPYDGKDISKDKPTKEYCPKGDLVFPLSQHIGAPAKPVVQVGDRVLKGQLIAEADGFVSASIHASVSGTVKAIEPRLVATGDMVMSVIIENDGLYEAAEKNPDFNENMSGPADIIQKIKMAGIVGMGGAGFPTHVKLSPKEPKDIKYIIANCAECEPYITADYRRMVEEPEKLVEGMRIILSLFPNAIGIFGIENNKPEAIRKIKELVAHEEKMEVKVLRTKYPQGSERQLIYATTKKHVNSSMLPADAGCIVDNVDTIVAVCRAVKEGLPLTERIITVTGDAIADPQNFKVCIGTNLSELIEAAGGFVEKPEKIIAGGPMMGFALFDTNIPATKTTSALLCLTKKASSWQETSACINCGRCTQSCPSLLVPSKLSDFSAHNQTEQFLKWNGMECMECGSCSYVCPAKRDLAQSIKAKRRAILADRRKKQEGK